MIELKKPLEQIINVIGKQEYNRNINYRLLYFCVKLKVDSGYLLLNNLTKEMLFITSEESNELENAGTLTVEKDTKMLAEHWFIVPKDFNDVALCDQLRQVLRLLESQKNYINNFTILPTTGCNARCFYCYEAGTPVKTMDETTAVDVANYIIKKSLGKKVRLNWFGGEPLCNIKAIDTICDILSQNNIDYYSTMTSNAYNFDNDVIRKAIELWKLNWIQITLDGMADTYNRVKNYKNQDINAFSKVIDNIENLCKNNVQVQVRMNMDKHNANELFDLAEYLYDKFGEFKNFVPYALPIYEDVGFEKTVRSNEERKAITEKYILLCKHFDELGFRRRTIHFNEIKISSCQADKKNWVIIMPDGHLGCCEHYVGSDFFGTIYEDTEKPKWSEFSKPLEKCKTCPVYPTCLLLERCPSATSECYEYKQFTKLDNIYSGMYDYYDAYLKRKHNGTINSLQ